MLLPMVFDLFVSYSHQDQDWVENLVQRLTHDGFTVFRDEESIEYGHNIHQSLEKAVQQSLRIVFVVSPSSLKSRWVRFETGLVFREVHLHGSSKLIPVLHQRSELPPSLAAIKSVDFASEEVFDIAYDRLLRALRRPSTLKYGPVTIDSHRRIGELSEALAERIKVYFDYSEEAVFAFVLACNELLKNALQHPTVSSPEAVLSCEMDSQRARLDVRDQGDGFDMAQFFDSARAETGTWSSGLFLVASQCDWLHAEKTAEGHRVSVEVGKQRLYHVAGSWQELPAMPASAMFSAVRIPRERWQYIRCNLASLTIRNERVLSLLARKVLIDPEKRNLVLLDLASVRYLDSSGNGELVSFYTELRLAQIELWLIILPGSRVMDLLTITQLITIFTVFPDRDSALQALSIREGLAP